MRDVGKRRGAEASGRARGRGGRAGRRRACSFRIVASAVCFSRSSSAMRFRCSSASRRWRSRRRASGSRGSGCAFGLLSPPSGRSDTRRSGEPPPPPAAIPPPPSSRRRGVPSCSSNARSRASRASRRCASSFSCIALNRCSTIVSKPLIPLPIRSWLWFASACRSGEGGVRDVGVGSDVGRDPNAPAARRSPPAAPPTCRSAAPANGGRGRVAGRERRGMCAGGRGRDETCGA